MEQRRLTRDLNGFAHADVFIGDLTPRETELYRELQLTGGSIQADALLACLGHALAGPPVFLAGAVVEVLAKATADEGDIFLIVRRTDGVFAHVLDSQTEAAGQSNEYGNDVPT